MKATIVVTDFGGTPDERTFQESGVLWADANRPGFCLTIINWRGVEDGVRVFPLQHRRVEVYLDGQSVLDDPFAVVDCDRDNRLLTPADCSRLRAHLTGEPDHHAQIEALLADCEED